MTAGLGSTTFMLKDHLHGSMAHRHSVIGLPENRRGVQLKIALSFVLVVVHFTIQSS